MLERIKFCFPKNPYPEDIFKMTEDEYIEAIPDPYLRTAISGFMGRFVYNAIKKHYLENLKEEFEDEI